MRWAAASYWKPWVPMALKQHCAMSASTAMSVKCLVSNALVQMYTMMMMNMSGDLTRSSQASEQVRVRNLRMGHINGESKAGSAPTLQAPQASLCVTFVPSVGSKTI